jgi:hypothetical protein
VTVVANDEDVVGWHIEPPGFGGVRAIHNGVIRAQCFLKNRGTVAPDATRSATGNLGSVVHQCSIGPKLEIVSAHGHDAIS